MRKTVDKKRGGKEKGKKWRNGEYSEYPDCRSQRAQPSTRVLNPTAHRSTTPVSSCGYSCTDPEIIFSNEAF